MRDLISQIFGTYSPVTFTDGNGVSVIPDGASGVDWTWLAGVLLFAITLYCVMRILGGAFKK